MRARVALAVLVFLAAVCAWANEPVVAPDHSLAVEEYVKRGAPAPDHAWTDGELIDAARVLQSIAAKDITQLPRKRSLRSGKFFARLFDLETARARSVMERLPAILRYWTPSNSLTIIYINATNQSEFTFDAELVDALQYMVALATQTAKLADEGFASLTKEQKENSIHLDRMKQMRASVINIVSGAVGTLGEAKGYRLSERLRLAKSLETSLPPLLAHFTPEGQELIRVQVRKLVAEAREPQIRAASGAILKAIATRAGARPAK